MNSTRCWWMLSSDKEFRCNWRYNTFKRTFKEVIFGLAPIYLMNSTCLCWSPFTRVRKPTTRTCAAGFFNENVWRRQALWLLLAEPCVKPACRPIGRKILWQLAIKLPSQRREERWNIWFLRIHKVTLVTAPAQTTCARSSRNDCIFSEKCNKMFRPLEFV